MGIGRAAKEKGDRGELKVVKMLQSAGFDDARRNYADKVDEQGVDVFAGTLLLQVKNWGKEVPMSKYGEINRHDGIRALVSNNTSTRGPWMITMKLKDFLAIAQDVGLLYDTSLIPPF